MSHAPTLYEAYITAQPERAACLLEQLAPEATQQLLLSLSPPKSFGLWPHFKPQYAAALLASLPRDFQSHILPILTTTQLGLILQALSADQAQAILTLLPHTQQIHLSRLMTYASSTVGAWMQTNALTVRAADTVQTAKDTLSHAALAQCADHCFVLDEHGGLLGHLSLSRLVVSPPQTPIGTLTQPMTPLKVYVPLEDALPHKDWLSHTVRPIVDRENQFMGYLTHAALYHALYQQREITDITQTKHASVWSDYVASIVTLLDASDVFKAEPS